MTILPTPARWFTRRRGEERQMKQITRREALQIARETLETAERERIEVARAEAKHGIQYKDETGD